MKVYVINFQEVMNHSSANALVRSLLDAFEELDDNYVFLTSYVDKQYKSNIRGHSKCFYFIFRLFTLITAKIKLQTYIRRTIQERLVDIAHYLTLRKEKDPYVLITSQYAPYSVKLASSRNNKTILIAGNFNDDLYYNVVTKEKERLGLKFQDIYSSKYRIEVYRSMMRNIDEVWCFSPLGMKSFEPKPSKLLPISLRIEKEKAKVLTVDDNKLTIGYIGFTSLLKGVHLLIEAITKSQHCSDIKLVICGYIDPQMKFLLDNSKVNVDFRGFVPAEEKTNTIKSFDCLAIPSLYDAGPTTIIEGIQCNVPVLASSGCGYADYIKDVPGCYVFETQNISDLRNKIDYIFENKRKIFDSLGEGVVVLGEKDYIENSLLEAIKEL